MLFHHWEPTITHHSSREVLTAQVLSLTGRIIAIIVVIVVETPAITCLSILDFVFRQAVDL